MKKNILEAILNEAPRKKAVPAAPVNDIDPNEYNKVKDIVKNIQNYIDDLYTFRDHLEHIKGTGLDPLIEGLTSLIDAGSDARTFGELIIDKDFGKGGPEKDLDIFYTRVFKFFNNDHLTGIINTTKFIQSPLKGALDYASKVNTAVTKIKNTRL